jgi:colicin import membrane protein
MGTLRATTTMHAALPLKGTNLRVERAEERARANALQAQIDDLNAEMAVARAEADRAVAEERLRADQLSKQVEALSAEVLRAEKQTAAALGRAKRAEADRGAERARAEALRTSIDELKAELAAMAEMGARELAIARHDAIAAQQAAAELRQAKAALQARGRWARLRAAWRAA